MYLVFSRPGPAHDWAMQEMIHPHVQLVSGFVRRLRPETSKEQAEIWTCCMLSPVSYFSIHRAMAFSIFDLQAYSPEFLQQVEERVAQMATRSFDLPYQPARFDVDAVSPVRD